MTLNVFQIAPRKLRRRARTCRHGGPSPRRKGNGFEREVDRLLRELGLAAERVPLSGPVKSPRFDHDISP